MFQTEHRRMCKVGIGLEGPYKADISVIMLWLVEFDPFEESLVDAEWVDGDEDEDGEKLWMERCEAVMKELALMNLFVRLLLWIRLINGINKYKTAVNMNAAPAKWNPGS